MRILAVFLILLMQNLLFASGGGNNGGGQSGPLYVCFADSYHQNKTQMTAPGIGSSYCRPSTILVDPNKKDSDYKCYLNDAENAALGNGGKYNNGTASIGSNKPWDTYRHCTKEDDWEKVAKCIKSDDTTEKEVGASYCVGQSSGYKFVPREKAIVDTYAWKFCANPDGKFNTSTKDKNYVTIPESVPTSGGIAISGGTDYPCELNSTSPAGGGTIDPSKPVDIIIQDDFVSADETRVQTKISGKSATFNVYVSGAGYTTSGLKEVACDIDGAEAKQGTDGWKGFIGGGSGRVKKYSTTNAFPKSGQHTITCTGTTDNDERAAGSATFYSAPNSYGYRASLNFTSHKGSVADYINQQETKIYYNGNSTFKHNNQNWVKKPVVMASSTISLNLANVVAYNYNNYVDTGVSSTIGVYQTPSNSLKMITAAPKTTANATGCNGDPVTPSTSTGQMSQGTLTSANILNLSSTAPIIGTMSVGVTDTTIRANIDSEKAAGKCGKFGNDKDPCPYPAIATYEFEYQVVPNDFNVEMLDSNGKPLKVLYFGQGTTPQVEDKVKVKVTAMGTSKNTLARFDSKCAAQSIDLNLEVNVSGLYLELKNPDGTKSSMIPNSSFKQGVAEVEKILVVQQSKDTPFNPNMTSEPVLPKVGDIKAAIEYSGFPSTSTYYPNYSPSIDGLSNIAVLRGRINALDTDNNATLSSITPTKVYYEFQCNYCNLDDLKNITGAKDYKPSPTQQGWFIDSTFDQYNATRLETKKMSIESGGLSINSVSAFKDGLQEISYGSASAGKYKLNILHGNYCGSGSNVATICSSTNTSPAAMPNFLLYNKYWNENVKWHTSSFIYVKGKAKDDSRDYGVDTKDAKNTRSGGRTGAF